MSAAKIGFARAAYRSGKCPGCGAPLVVVAGQGDRHLLGGQELSVNGTAKGIKGRTIIRRNPTEGVIVRTVAGDKTTMNPADPMLCPWSADELAALVHIGSGLVSA